MFLSLYKFKLLSRDQQAETTWEKGVYLADRIIGNYSVMLYRVDCFYVEIIYNSLDPAYLHVNSFLSEDLLDSYLEKIDISELLKLC